MNCKKSQGESMVWYVMDALMPPSSFTSLWTFKKDSFVRKFVSVVWLVLEHVNKIFGCSRSSTYN